jgi:hypothetical protein
VVICAIISSINSEASAIVARFNQRVRACMGHPQGKAGEAGR